MQGVTFFALLATTHAALPSQISLSVGNDGVSSMNVSWVTSDRTNRAHVKYLSKDGVFKAQHEGETTFYHFASEALPSQDSGGLHHATMKNLLPLTEYVYQVGDASTKEWSDWYSFTTLPKAGPIDKPFSLALIGDLGQTDDSKTTVQQMSEDEDINMVICVGDMSYADTNQSRWNVYGDMVQGISSRLPWMVGPGNHEIESDFKTGYSFVPYEHYFNMPSMAPALMAPNAGQVGCVHRWPPPCHDPGETDCTPSAFMTVYDYGNSFYSYDAASLHVITLNPYTSTNATSRQGIWLAKDLASVDRSKTPWVIVVMHCPWYNSNQHHRNEFQALQMQTNMEHLFLKYRVDMILAGHVHAYERVFPVAYGELNDKGITHVTIGGAGNREGHATPFEDPSPDWSAFREDKTYGHGKITMFNDTHMQWVWYSNEEGEKVAYDQTWIIRDPKTSAIRHLSV